MQLGHAVALALLLSTPAAAKWSHPILSGRLPLIPYPAAVVGDVSGEWSAFADRVSLLVGDGVAADSLAVRTLQEQLSQQSVDHAVASLSRQGGLIRRHRSSLVEDGGGIARSGISTISIALTGATASDTDDESYHLQVGESHVKLEAPALAGLLYGAQTLKQLMSMGGEGLPRVTIDDKPRFKWRGVMLDTSRHFFSAEHVKSLLETMAAFKLNRFHWHLTDDQGWRVPISGYPSLTQIGAQGVTSGSYSPEEIKDVVDFARARHIEVIPEVDLPGHVQAAVAAYPELGNSDISGWVKPSGPSSEWGVHEYTLAPTNKVMGFLGSVFESMNKLFPGKWVHVGGDEVRTEEWMRSPRAASSASQMGESASHLQAFFNGKVAALLKSEGRRAICWDESQHIGGLPDDSIIMAWRNVDEARLAAQSGRDVINADSAAYYLDHYQGPEISEPKAICCHTSLADIYNYDPMPSGLSSEEQKHVLGGQAQLWSEYFPTWRHVEYMAHPRSLALAERLWTPAESTVSFEDFSQRLKVRLQDLDKRGVNYRPVE